MHRRFLISLLSLTAAGALHAAEEARVELRSTITGNQEQPKVLYIVPWQAPGSGDDLAQPLEPMLKDVFAPIDRAEFQRELRYGEEARALQATEP